MLNVETESQLYDEDWDFLEAHYDELLEKYPEQWVAVVDKRLVGADPDLLTLLTRLKPMGLPKNRIVTEKVTAEEEIWILPSQ